MLSIRDGRPRKVRNYDFKLYRDIVIVYKDTVIINGKGIPYYPEIWKDLLQLNKKRTKKETPDMFEVFVWDFSCNKVRLLRDMQQKNAKQLYRRDAISHVITNEFVVTNFNNIITQGSNIVNIKQVTNLDNDLEALTQYVRDFRQNTRSIHFSTDTFTNLSRKKSEKAFLSDESKRLLAEDTKQSMRIPCFETVHELIRYNKAGISYINPDIKEKLIKDVYAPDVSSCYASMLFSNDYPIGEMKRCKYSYDLICTCINKGIWFYAVGRSKEFIHFDDYSFRPYKDKKSPKINDEPNPKDFWTDEEGYYCYAIAPYDYKALTEFKGYNPFEDNRIEWITLNICTKMGNLHKAWLDFIIDLYNSKNNAPTVAKAMYYKECINSILGRASMQCLWKNEDGTLVKSHWKFYLNNYWCPQFHVHMMSKSRYECLKLASTIPKEDLLIIVTDSIKTTNSKILWSIDKYNREFSQKLKEVYGYESEIGKWKQDKFKYFVATNYCSYCFERPDGSFKAVINGAKTKKDGENLLKSMDELFKENTIRVFNKDGGTRTFWKNTENRLKAKEIYYEMDKSDQGVQAGEEQKDC